ncbi:MAG: allophanate hydrolase [Chloroflexi bacterium]|nr:allophanate hydrolase [Chloroflexota bacterium]
MTQTTTQSLDLLTLRQAYANGSLRPSELIEELYRRIAAYPDQKIWISLLAQAEVLAQARRLETLTPREAATLPLYGVPFAVKDNFDVAGHPTTVGCPDFAYTPAVSATAVEKLAGAGALLLGKTNLDQFATGLVGIRSPYGPVANPFNPAYISGGSSSGSAVAVACGLVSFALGTDTAGSGRIPAGYTNTIGLKPTRGLISAAGVFPACRTLDCVSIFALTVGDAEAVLRVCEGVDGADAYSRARPLSSIQNAPDSFRFGLPRAEQLEFFGNDEYARLYAEGIALLEAIGGTRVEFDFAPLATVANLLYEGPWVAERYAAVKAFFDARPEAFLPVIRAILEQARAYSAADVFTAQYRLEELRGEIAPLWESIDCLALPTAGTIYTIAEVEADPLRLNSNLGRYTNFANLLDLCALALPNGFQSDGLPAGLTLLARAFGEDLLLDIGREFQQRRGLPLGATGLCKHG